MLSTLATYLAGIVTGWLTLGVAINLWMAYIDARTNRRPGQPTGFFDWGPEYDHTHENSGRP